MTTERISPGLQLPERAMLDEWLDYQRATLLMKCDDLTDAQLRQPSVSIIDVIARPRAPHGRRRAALVP